MERKIGFRKREKSQAKIMGSLLKEPQRFNELKIDTRLSRKALADTLKIMKNDNVVELVLINDTPKYRLTKEGENLLEKYLYLSHVIDEIRFRDGMHFRDYSTLWNSTLAFFLPWGIESDLTVDTKIHALNLLTPKDVLEIEELVFRKISKNIPKKNLDKKLKGKMVLGFTIDYEELIKSIKNQSLDHMDNMTKKEIKLLNKYNDDPESMTQKEIERMNDLREKTSKKLIN